MEIRGRSDGDLMEIRSSLQRHQRKRRAWRPKGNMKGDKLGSMLGVDGGYLAASYDDPNSSRRNQRVANLNAHFDQHVHWQRYLGCDRLDKPPEHGRPCHEFAVGPRNRPFAMSLQLHRPIQRVVSNPGMRRRVTEEQSRLGSMTRRRR